MKTRKLKRLLVILITLLVLAGLIGVFAMIIVNTPNINAKITIKSDGVLGTVSTWIRNAENGLPYNYFSFDNTGEEEYSSTWKSNNIQFKGDKETITIEILIKNMSHYKVKSNISYKKPHSNANVSTMLNNSESEINELILEPNSENTILLIIGKSDLKKPIRANLNLTLSLSEFLQTIA